jgi:hypothetical protein
VDNSTNWPIDQEVVAPMTCADEVAQLRAEVTRLHKRLFLVLVVSLAGLALAGFGIGRALLWEQRLSSLQQGSESRVIQIEAQEYRLLDPDGNLRGFWSCPPAGPLLILLDENGRPALELRQMPGGGGFLKVNDGKGNVLFRKP